MRTIVDEYGVLPPDLALLRRIEELLPPEMAAMLTEEYYEARRRYLRAARVREAQELIERIERRPDYPHDLPREVYQALISSREVVARKDEYIAGTWSRQAGRRAGKRSAWRNGDLDNDGRL